MRPEAQPLKWKTLTQDQRKLAVDIHDWLIDFVGKPLPKPPSPGRRSPFDYQEIIQSHFSNIILIDGGRGSGKTSILVTLLNLWGRLAAGDKPRDLMAAGASEKTVKAPSNKKKKPSSTSWARLIEQIHGPLQGKLIPVRPLDVQPLPVATSLLAWIGTRIMELVDHLDDPAGRRAGAEPAKPIASWEPDWKRELRSRSSFKKLMQCAALGWSSNLPDRKGTLDPESYAVELNDAERARLGMVDSWREFTATVVADAHRLYPELVHEDARIIVPIDDADMNPHRCVELLELLRSLWSPHVVFVVTGNSKLFLKMLQLHYEQVLRPPIQALVTSATEGTPLEADPYPKKLALQMYDKVIPSGHRFALRALASHERMKRMRKALDGRLHRDPRDPPLPENLAGYFELSPQFQDGLPHRLRRILNLRHALKGTQSAGQQVYRLWEEAIENSEWGRDLLNELHPFVQVDPKGRLRVEVAGRFTPETRRLSPQLSDPGSNKLLVDTVTNHTFSLSDPEDDDETHKLPGYLTALLMLASSVAADEQPDSASSNRPAPYGLTYKLVSTRLPVPAFPTKRLSFRWPLPNWSAPLDFNIFEQSWEESLSAISSVPIKAENWENVLVYLYLTGVFTVGTQRKKLPTLVIGPAGTPQLPSFQNVKQVVHQLVKAVQEGQRSSSNGGTSARSAALQKWLLGRALLVATPESGLSASLANSLLDEWLGAAEKSSEFRAQIITAARQARLQRAENALSDIRLPDELTAENLLSAIDAAHPTFHWAHVIENRTLSPQLLAQHLEWPIKRIFIRHDQAASARVPGSLDEYLAILEVKKHLPSASNDEFQRLRSRLERFEKTQGSAQLAALDLWHFIVSKAGATKKEPVPWVSRRGSNIEVKLPAVLQQWLDQPMVRRAGTRLDVPLGEKRALRVYELTNSVGSTSPAVESMLQVAHDVSMDERDTAPSPKEAIGPRLAFLPHAATIWAGVEINWPVPAWTTFFDWKLTDRLWERIDTTINSFAQDPGEDLMEILLGAVIHSLLGGVLAICEQRTFDVPFINLKLRPEDLDQTMNRLFGLLKGGVLGQRQARVTEWVLWTCTLYGAPETGLSEPLARGFLKSVTPVRSANAPKHASVLPHDREDYPKIIRELRRDRIRLSLRRAVKPANDTDVTRFLLSVDQQAGENHPWFELFGRDSDPIPGF